MAEGTPSSDVFGFITDEGVAAIGLDDDEPEAQQPVEETQTQASPEAGASAGTEVAEEQEDQGTQPEVQQEGQPAEPEQPEAPAQPEAEAKQEEPAPKIFGRFDSLEQAEASYKNIQGLQKRTAEKANQLESRLNEAMGYLQKVAPIIQQLNQQQQTQAQQVPENFDPSDTQQLQAYVTKQIEAGVQAKLAELSPQLQSQSQQQVQQQQAAQVVQAFQSEVPDFFEGSESWTAVDDYIRSLQTDRTGKVDISRYPLTLDNLRVAYKVVTDPVLYEVVEDLYIDPSDPVVLAHAEEAAKDPALLKVLKATPDWVKTPEGMELARGTAKTHVALGQATQQANQPSPQQKPAFVETGGAGAPSVSAPGQVPDDDDWEATVRWWNQNQDNVFGFTGAKP